jgi:hypothetical protein
MLKTMSLGSPFAKGGYRGIFHVLIKSPLPPFSIRGENLTFYETGTFDSAQM